jgi:cation transport regulator
MPYAGKEDLPPSVRDHLPSHAQDIYREAFNHAWRQYGGDEPTAHRVAWAAVKRLYVKRDGIWVPKSILTAACSETAEGTPGNEPSASGCPE